MSDEAANPSISQLLSHGTQLLGSDSESARLDAEILLGKTLGMARAALYSHGEKRVSASAEQGFLSLIHQRRRRKPIAHLTGTREFWSLALDISAATLVPRPETELLVEQALGKIPADASMHILDLGTGCGAITLAIASERPACRFVASDNSAAALELARSNAKKLTLDNIAWCSADWFDGLPNAEKYHVIVSNPPYIGTEEKLATDAELQFEPPQALYSGPDGLQAIRTIVAAAKTWLIADGWLLLEHGMEQGDAVTALLQQHDFVNVYTANDLAGLPRVSGAQWQG